jgi:hypothetical protein
MRDIVALKWSARKREKFGTGNNFSNCRSSPLFGHFLKEEIKIEDANNLTFRTFLSLLHIGTDKIYTHEKHLKQDDENRVFVVHYLYHRCQTARS